MTHLFYVYFTISIQEAAEEGEKNSEKDVEIVRSIFDFEIIEEMTSAVRADYA